MRATLAALESGNVDAGIVYKTDASICKAVKVVFEVPAKEGPDISYPIAVVKGSKNPEVAMKFLDYLKSEQALTVFRKYGIAGVAQSQWEIVGFTVLVAGLATVAIFPFGVALAWLLARRSWSGKSIVKTLVALPLVMPPVTKKFDDAMNNNDAAARAALYTEDAIFGRETIERHYADLLQKVHFSNHVLTDDQDSPHITGTAGKEVWETSQPEIAAKAKVRHWGTPSAGRRLIAVPTLPATRDPTSPSSPPISVAVNKRLFCHDGTGSRGPMLAPAFESARGESGVKT